MLSSLRPVLVASTLWMHLAPEVPAAAQVPIATTGPEVAEAVKAWTDEHGSQWCTHLNKDSAAVWFLFGSSLEASELPASREDFVRLARHYLDLTQGMTQVSIDTLTAPVLHDLSSIGPGREKLVVAFRQDVGSVEVENGRVLVLMTWDGDLLAIKSAALPNTSDRMLDLVPRITAKDAEFSARLQYRQSEGIQASGVDRAPGLILTRQVIDGLMNARLAWRIRLSADGMSPREYLVAADSTSRAILRETSLTFHCDAQPGNQPRPDLVQGNVQAKVTLGFLPVDVSGTALGYLAMPWLKINPGVSYGYQHADINGDFSYSVNAGATPSTEFKIRGYLGTADTVYTNHEYAETYAIGGGTHQISLNPSGTAQTLAAANAFYHVQNFRAWVEAIDPAASAALQGLTSISVHDSAPGYGNASFTPGSPHVLRFAPPGSGYVDMAYSTVVDHEFGHLADYVFVAYNQTSDGWNEGSADAWSMFVLDTPYIAEAYTGTPGTWLRDAFQPWRLCQPIGDTNCLPPDQYIRGSVLSGALWQVRENFRAKYSGTSEVDSLFLNWMVGFSMGSSGEPAIDQDVLVAWLVLDDSVTQSSGLQNWLVDGSPNWAEIQTGFQAFGWKEFVPHEFEFVHDFRCDSKPDSQIVTQGFPIYALVTRNSNFGAYGVEVEYKINGGSLNTISLLPDPLFPECRAFIPAPASPAVVQYRLKATGILPSGSIEEYYPPDSWHRFAVGNKTVVYSEGFEGSSANGWTHWMGRVQDDWQRDTPNGQAGVSYSTYWEDPDHAGSGFKAWGNDLGLGGNDGAYEAYVQNFLQSPLLNSAAAGNLSLRFLRWLTVEGPGDQARVVFVNGNSGLETELWSSQSQILDTTWRTVSFDLSSFGTIPFSLRYELDADWYREYGGWNIDDVEVFTVAATAGTTDYGQLAGPPEAITGETVDFHVCSPFPYRPVYLLASLSLSPGYPWNGMVMDIGQPWMQAASGQTDKGGTTILPVTIPPGHSGQDVYFEAWFSSPQGNFESNYLKVHIN